MSSKTNKPDRAPEDARVKALSARAILRFEDRYAVELRALEVAHGAQGYALPHATDLRDIALFEQASLTPFGDLVREPTPIYVGDASEALPAYSWRTKEELVTLFRSATHPLGRGLSALVAEWLGLGERFEGSTPRPWWLTPNIALFPIRSATLLPATHTNAFLIGEGAEWVLVEPAKELGGNEVGLWLERERALGKTILGKLPTHHHHDHFGHPAVRELPLFAHPITAELIGEKLDSRRGDRAYTDGDRLSLGEAQFEFVHTPGHAPGHLCIVDTRSHVALVGDMVAGVGTILVDPSDGNMTEYLASLKKLEARSLRAAIPAHGGYLETPSQSVFPGTHAHRLRREAKVEEALSEVPQGEMELTKKVYADVPAALWPIARRSLRAHLIRLQELGRGEEMTEGWRRPQKPPFASS